jgi:hypothetical protein
VLKKPIGRSLVKVYHFEGDSRALENKRVACCLLQSQGITKGCKCPFVSNFLIVISLGLAAPERFFLVSRFTLRH